MNLERHRPSHAESCPAQLPHSSRRAATWKTCWPGHQHCEGFSPQTTTVRLACTRATWDGEKTQRADASGAPSPRWWENVARCNTTFTTDATILRVVLAVTHLEVIHWYLVEHEIKLFLDVCVACFGSHAGFRHHLPLWSPSSWLP